MTTLTPADVDMHAALTIDAGLLGKAGVRRVNDREARDLLGINGKPGDFSGIEYPYLDPVTGRRVTSRIRLDRPPIKADGTPNGKYRTSYGDNRHLFFPPGAAAFLADTSVPALIVESEKGALALTAAAKRVGRQVLVVALGGCWNFSGRIGKDVDAHGARVDVYGPLPDFQRVVWQSRVATILFDARPNGSVQAARKTLSRFLRQWGADVRHAHLLETDGRVNGPDDHLGTHGDAATWHVIDAATSEEFVKDEDGDIIAGNLDNVRLALMRLDVSLSYDEFSRDILIGHVPLDDVAVDKLWVQINDTFRFRPSKDVLRTVVVTEAHLAAFHPVRQYLDALQWDGQSRLDDWLVRYGGAADTAYTRAVGALPLIAAVRRVRHPGCKFDELLVLEGKQGTLKSSALRALCARDSWFSDDLPLGTDSKQTIERTTGRWVIEAAELHGNRGREAEQLKAFLSRQVDGPVRLAYARIPVTIPRQFVLIGTTNASTSYLKDATGARRFWPVKIDEFDVDALTAARDQLWAEAAAREAQEYPIRLPRELWAAAGQQQEDRRAIDPWESTLEPILEGDGISRPMIVPVSAIWDALQLEASHRNNGHAQRVTDIVERHGFVRRSKIRIDNKPTSCWVREEDPCE